MSEKRHPPVAHTCGLAFPGAAAVAGLVTSLGELRDLLTLGADRRRRA